jgi:hypothetical protein
MIIAITHSCGLIGEEIFIAVIAAYAYNIFIEMYRYSGVFKNPKVGEIGYAARGVLSLVPVLYLLNQDQTLSIEIVLYCMIIDVVIGLMLGAALYRSFSFEIVNIKYLKIIFIKFKELIVKNKNALLLMASTAIMTRLLLNFDKMVGYISESIKLSPNYYFSSVLAISYFGMVESVANNKYAPMLLSGEISSGKFLKKQFNLIVLFSFIAICITLTSLIDRFQYDIFLLILSASALNMMSNAVSIVLYAKKKDILNFASIFITLIFCGLIVNHFIINNPRNNAKVDLEMCIAYISMIILLLLARVSFMMQDRFQAKKEF